MTTYVYEAGTGALLSWEGPSEAGKEQKGSQIYDAYGRAEATELADGTRQYVAYDAEGNVTVQWGSQMYPATYQYNKFIAIQRNVI